MGDAMVGGWGDPADVRPRSKNSLWEDGNQFTLTFNITYIHNCIHIHIYVNQHTHVRIHVTHTVHTSTYTHVDIYVYTYTFTHIHLHTHSCKMTNEIR